MEIIIEICNNCGKKLLPTGELINMKVVHTNQDNKRKEESIKVCWECYGHVLKYPTDDFGCHLVDDDFKLYYIKIKKLFTKKKKEKNIVPVITINGKEIKEKITPSKFAFFYKNILHKDLPKKSTSRKKS